jgi:hypothetical protein
LNFGCLVGCVPPAYDGGVAEFPVTVKRRNSIGNVLTISCVTIKDALKILKRFQERGYREVRIVDVAGHIVDESKFLMPRRP